MGEQAWDRESGRTDADAGGGGGIERVVRPHLADGAVVERHCVEIVRGDVVAPHGHDSSRPLAQGVGAGGLGLRSATSEETSPEATDRLRSRRRTRGAAANDSSTPHLLRPPKTDCVLRRALACATRSAALHMAAREKVRRLSPRGSPDRLGNHSAKRGCPSIRSHKHSPHVRHTVGHRRSPQSRSSASSSTTPPSSSGPPGARASTTSCSPSSEYPFHGTICASRTNAAKGKGSAGPHPENPQFQPSESSLSLSV